MNRIVQLQQGTAEWLAYRRSMRNASESAAVLGLSPWMSPYQLWLLKTGRAEPVSTAAMAHGTRLEPEARDTYEAQTGHVMQPLVIQDPDGVYSASLDGMVLDGSLILEVKCPFHGQLSELWQQAAAGEVPEHYQCQIQHQLMVSGAAKAHFWVYGDGFGTLVEVWPDPVWFERIRAGWEAFQVHLDRDSPPPLTDADTRLRSDSAWVDAATAYLAAKRASDEASEALEVARQRLLALAEHPKEQGAGVAVTRYWRQGNVDYKKVPQLAGVELEKYRGSSRQDVRVSTT